MPGPTRQEPLGVLEVRVECGHRPEPRKCVCKHARRSHKKGIGLLTYYMECSRRGSCGCFSYFPGEVLDCPECGAGGGMHEGHKRVR